MGGPESRGVNQETLRVFEFLWKQKLRPLSTPLIPLGKIKTFIFRNPFHNPFVRKNKTFVFHNPFPFAPFPLFIVKGLGLQGVVVSLDLQSPI